MAAHPVRRRQDRVGACFHATGLLQITTGIHDPGGRRTSGRCTTSAGLVTDNARRCRLGHPLSMVATSAPGCSTTPASTSTERPPRRHEHRYEGAPAAGSTPRPAECRPPTRPCRPGAGPVCPASTGLTDANRTVLLSCLSSSGLHAGACSRTSEYETASGRDRIRTCDRGVMSPLL